MSRNLRIGKLGEKYAAKYLKDHGYKIIEINVRSRRWGEIDIIAKDRETLVFVEVKTRLTQEFGHPEEQVRFYKIRSIKRAAYYYKIKNPDTPDLLRIDVVTVQLHPTTLKPYEINHFKNVTQ